VDVGLAGPQDAGALARLLQLFASPAEREQSPGSFEVDLAGWWAEHARSHIPFVARTSGSDVVGMAWLAVVPRVPRPGRLARLSADVQSVFVLPEQRGKGIGGALVRAVTDHALRLGAEHVAVHSSEGAVTLYERLGFASSPLLLQTPAPALVEKGLSAPGT
jgi:GNAT superfamily N-acetyltransferase